MKNSILSGAVMLLAIPVIGFAARPQAGTEELQPLHIESFLTPPGKGGKDTKDTGDARDPTEARDSDVVVSLRGYGVGALVEGDLLVAERPLLDQVAGRVHYETGELKVTKVQGSRALAVVKTDGKSDSARILGKYNKVMAGDVLHPRMMAFAPAVALTPEVTLEYNLLFTDPNAGATSMELSPVGRQILASAVQSLGTVRASLLSVEGYADPSGDAESNQVESYERALTIRRHLVDALNFDPERVKAFGLGEQEPADTSNLPGSVERNRRIVIKIVPHKAW